MWVNVFCFITAGFSQVLAQKYDKEINFRTIVSPMLFPTTEKRYEQVDNNRFVPVVSVLVRAIARKKNIGTIYVHELFWMLQCNSIGNLLFYVLREIGYCCTSMKTRTAAHSWFVPHTTDSLFFVFPSDIWCKINKLLKYYKYQLTKPCLAGRLDGFKVSSWFLKIMKLVEDRIAKKCRDFHHCCRMVASSLFTRLSRPIPL